MAESNPFTFGPMITDSDRFIGRRAELEIITVLLCLDEFETLLRGDFDNRFFAALRSWANEGVLIWITVSALPLTSPFFNLLATVLLQGWATAEVDALLNQANATAYSFTNIGIKAWQRKSWQEILRHLWEKITL